MITFCDDAVTFSCPTNLLAKDGRGMSEKGEVNPVTEPARVSLLFIFHRACA